MKYMATLVRGSDYTLKGTVFKRNEPHEIDESTKEHLEANALDRRISQTVVEGKKSLEVDKVQKFTFEPVEAEKPKTEKAEAQKNAEDDSKAEATETKEASSTAPRGSGRGHGRGRAKS